MNYETIIYEKSEGIAEITLNRPEKMNAISFKVTEELLSALDDASADEYVGVVVIKGAGEKAFTAGDDIGPKDAEVWMDLRPNEMFTVMREKHFYKVLDVLRSMMKPVIAAVHGYCLGSGPELALACDIVIASETAIFSLPFVNIGVVSGTALLPRVVGYHKACELLFTGDRISARQAEAMGMVNRVVAPEQFQSTVRELAQRLAQKPTPLIGWTKWALNRAMSSSFRDALDYELSSMALTHLSKYLPSLAEGQEPVHSKKKK